MNNSFQSTQNSNNITLSQTSILIEQQQAMSSHKYTRNIPITSVQCRKQQNNVVIMLNQMINKCTRLHSTYTKKNKNRQAQNLDFCLDKLQNNSTIIDNIFQNINKYDCAKRFHVIQKVKTLISMEQFRLMFLIQSKFNNKLQLIMAWIGSLQLTKILLEQINDDSKYQEFDDSGLQDQPMRKINRKMNEINEEQDGNELNQDFNLSINEDYDEDESKEVMNLSINEDQDDKDESSEEMEKYSCQEDKKQTSLLFRKPACKIMKIVI